VVEFYKGEGALIAREFASETRAALDLIAGLPQGTPADEDGIRKKVLRKFPYTIVYTLTDDLIEVIAFAHQRRKPDYWRTRL
jgi:toxin ParE1/3/4